MGIFRPWIGKTYDEESLTHFQLCTRPRMLTREAMAAGQAVPGEVQVVGADVQHEFSATRRYSPMEMLSRSPETQHNDLIAGSMGEDRLWKLAILIAALNLSRY